MDIRTGKPLNADDLATLAEPRAFVNVVDLDLEAVPLPSFIARNARFTQPHFKNMTLPNLVFEDCVLIDPVFDDCTFDGARFIRCRMENPKFIGNAKGSSSNVLFEDVTMTGGKFQSVEFLEPHISGGSWRHSTIEKSAMHGLRLTAAYLMGIHVDQADMQGARGLVSTLMGLRGCSLNLSHSDLHHCDFVDWDAKAIDFRESQISGPGFRYISIPESQFDQALIDVEQCFSYAGQRLTIDQFVEMNGQHGFPARLIVPQPRVQARPQVPAAADAGPAPQMSNSMLGRALQASAARRSGTPPTHASAPTPARDLASAPPRTAGTMQPQGDLLSTLRTISDGPEGP